MRNKSKIFHTDDLNEMINIEEPLKVSKNIDHPAKKENHENFFSSKNNENDLPSPTRLKKQPSGIFRPRLLRDDSLREKSLFFRKTSSKINVPQLVKQISSKNSDKISKSQVTPKLTRQHIKKAGLQVREEKKEVEELKVKTETIESSISDKSALSGRKDVVFKTLLRSVKRYYSTLFEDETNYASLTKSKQEKY